MEDLRHAGFPIVSRSTRREQGYRLTADPAEVGAYVQREVSPRARRFEELERCMDEAQRRLRASRDEGMSLPAQQLVLLEKEVA